MTKADISTDYLVIGAGISGLAFVDELLTRTDASITIIDKRDVPGGHWNDAYPFVKLHQPSSFYGVQSKELSEDRIDESGPNKGLLSLSSGPEIVSYCHGLMRDRLLPSGRITYLPSTEFQPDGKIRGILSGKQLTVDVKKRVVDASYYANSIPLTHTRAFAVDPAVICIPPNFLPRLASDFTHFTVLGAGKTAVDACMWLLGNGVDPSYVRWIIPADYWYMNRAVTQTGEKYFQEVTSTLIDAREAMGQAENATDLAHRHESCGMWLRLDPSVEPLQFHGAIVSPGEMAELRRIKDVVRQGHVTNIGPDSLAMTRGSVSTHPKTLYVDCTASAVRDRPLVPVFQPKKIVLQLIRFPQVPFSAALTAFLESLPMEDEERNSMALPIPFRKTVDDYIMMLVPDMQNRALTARHPEVRKWVRQSRLDVFVGFDSRLRSKDAETVAMLARMKQATIAAAFNLPKLVAGAKNRPSL